MQDEMGCWQASHESEHYPPPTNDDLPLMNVLGITAGAVSGFIAGFAVWFPLGLMARGWW